MEYKLNPKKQEDAYELNPRSQSSNYNIMPRCEYGCSGYNNSKSFRGEYN